MQYDGKLVCSFNNISVDLFHPSKDRYLGSLQLEEGMELAALYNPTYKAKTVTEEQ